MDDDDEYAVVAVNNDGEHLRWHCQRKVKCGLLQLNGDWETTTSLHSNRSINGL